MMLRRTLAALFLAHLCAACSLAQRHSGDMSPPTPRPRPPIPAPIAPMSSGLGPIQFVQVDYGVPAPQSLTRQLQAEDDRTRIAALSAIGAPAQYLQRGHVPQPRLLQLEFAAMGQSDEQDAILTAELDQHIVTAILVPSDGVWRRVATVLFSTSAADTSMVPSTFLRVSRSVLQRDRYRAIFTATTSGPNGSSNENQAFMRVINNRAVVVLSFVSESRVCDAGDGHGHGKHHGGCDVTLRWVQADPTQPGQHALMVAASGRLSAGEAASPLSHAREFEMQHLHDLLCQPFVFNESSQHFEPTAAATACNVPR